MQAMAPGKLILSGEHSVVYGAPAIAVAVASFVTATFRPNRSDNVTLVTHSGSSTRSIESLADIQACLDQRYEQFEHEDIAIRDVLTDPTDLLFYTLAYAGFDAAGTILIDSELPIGGGMGSSAACIAALLRLNECVQQALPQTAQSLAQHVQYCERLQHGKGSLIDAATISCGGMVKVTSTTTERLPLTLDGHWYVWNSGAPESTTGEVVCSVRKRVKSHDIWQKFAHTTHQLESAIAQNNAASIKSSIAHNNALLCDIGVTPARIANTIRAIEQLGGSAKICGAGSIKGNTAGQVLVYFSDQPSNDTLAHINVPLTPLKPALRGAYAQ